jgi:flagellar basal-body rod modification protein FlgD
METSPITQTTTATDTATGTDALSKLSGDYTLFLKLLTSQMTNQDPLNPMDTSQYTQQLVQYSQVEQSIQQSRTLKDILARLSSQDMIEASSLIGRTVSYDSTSAGLIAASPASWAWKSQRTPATLSATITDSGGKVIDTRPLEPSSSHLAWDGMLADGTRARDGVYTLALQAKDSSGGDISTKIWSSGVVQAVSLEDNALSLTINGQTQAASNLMTISEAQ